MSGDDGRRHLYHTTGGDLDLSRLIEQLIPAVVIGAFVVFANFKVTSGQVDDLRNDMHDAQVAATHQQEQIQAQAEKLAGISAQIATLLSQQVAMNTSTDARLTFLERERYRQTPQATAPPVMAPGIRQ